MNVEKILSDLEAKHPGEKEYLQAVKEVLLSNLHLLAFAHLVQFYSSS